MTTTTPPTSQRPPSAPAPLAPVIAVVFLGSLGTGAVTNGVFFVTSQKYDFTPIANLALGFSLGAVYILGALAIGPFSRALAARHASISTRNVAAAVMLLLGLLCAVPLLIARPWAMWLFTLAYIPFTGAVWPIAESYISGGRRGPELRRAIGVFNLAWASAVAASFWGMSLLMEHAPLWIIGALGIVHILCVPLVLLWPSEPARHHDSSEPHPEVYERLLPCFRWLLVLSYVLLAALNPIMPWRLESLEAPRSFRVASLAVAWSTLLVSVWQVSRVAMFVLFQHWGGWHGRWRTPLWTGGALLAGFTLVLLAPSLPWLIAALALFGVGMGGVYCGALYYGLAVGHAEVDAGGRHEAAIGVGYSLGPFAALVAWGLVSADLLPPDRVAVATLAVVGIFTVVGVGGAWRAARKPPATGQFGD